MARKLNDKFYLIIHEMPGGATTVETTLETADFDDAVDAVAKGYWPREILGVIYVDLEAGTNKNVSSEVAQAVSRMSFNKSDEVSVEAERFLDSLGIGYYVESPSLPSDPDPDYKHDLEAA